MRPAVVLALSAAVLALGACAAEPGPAAAPSPSAVGSSPSAVARSSSPPPPPTDPEPVGVLAGQSVRIKTKPLLLRIFRGEGKHVAGVTVEVVR